MALVTINLAAFFLSVLVTKFTVNTQRIHFVFITFFLFFFQIFSKYF